MTSIMLDDLRECARNKTNVRLTIKGVFQSEPFVYGVITDIDTAKSSIRMYDTARTYKHTTLGFDDIAAVSY